MDRNFNTLSIMRMENSKHVHNLESILPNIWDEPNIAGSAYMLLPKYLYSPYGAYKVPSVSEQMLRMEKRNKTWKQ